MIRADVPEDSPYEPRFSQGATITPRVLFFVERQSTGPLGLAQGSQLIKSSRSANENAPWRQLTSLEGVVEPEFIRPILMGENVLPYRLSTPREAVLPLEGTDLINGDSPRIDQYPFLAQWWRTAEQAWNEHRSSQRLTLVEQLDFRRKLSAQLPGAALRIVYAASGMHLCAAIVDDQRVIIEHGLYWASVATMAEAMYLCAILNHPATTDLVRPLMSYGKDERHIDKAVWHLPIPLFDDMSAEHLEIVRLGSELSDIAAAVDLRLNSNFVASRRTLRQALGETTQSERLGTILESILAI